MIYYSIGHVAASFCLKHKRDNDECILQVGPSSFQHNFFKRQLHIHLFYYYKYLISLKLYLISLLQIVIKVENTKKIENTGHIHCPVLPSFLYRTKNQNTGQSG